MELCKMKNGKYRYGLTEVTVKNNILIVSHNGNMGNTIERSINPNLEALQLPVIEELKREYKVIIEDGSPDYMYLIKFRLYE